MLYGSVFLTVKIHTLLSHIHIQYVELMYKFIEQKTKQRLVNWHAFRLQLENSETPLEDVVNYFQSLPRVKVYTDPYDQTTWPTAWQLIDENEYCQFNILRIGWTAIQQA